MRTPSIGPSRELGQTKANSSPPKFVVGVWKDRLSIRESVEMARQLSSLCQGLMASRFIPAVAPAPFAAVPVCDALKGSPIDVIYQDVHWSAGEGSYIGSTPIRVLPELGISVALVGHSERRRFFGETNDDIHKKLSGLIAAGVHPILCVGDDVDDLNERRRILTEQLHGALCPSRGDQINISQLTVAYEPVWAISTWRTARSLPSGEEVADMLALTRQVTAAVTSCDTSQTSFLFGGSVGPTNADEYFANPGVDGALVGGASLRADSMATVFEAASRAWSE